MRIQQTRIFLALVTTLFCPIAFSSTLPDAGQALSFRGPDESGVIFAATDQAGDPAWFEGVGGRASVTQEPLLLARQTKVFVCHFTPNGKFHTQHIPEDTAQRLIENSEGKSNYWLLGKCEDIVSG